MVKALAIGFSVMTGILIGRIQVVENHAANAALETSARLEQDLAVAKRETTRARILLDATERQVTSMWSRLEPMLDDFTRAESVLDRDAARRRIETLRWEMSEADTRIAAARAADVRTALRHARVKRSFGE